MEQHNVYPISHLVRKYLLKANHQSIWCEVTSIYFDWLNRTYLAQWRCIFHRISLETIFLQIIWWKRFHHVIGYCPQDCMILSEAWFGQRATLSFLVGTNLNWNLLKNITKRIISSSSIKFVNYKIFFVTFWNINVIWNNIHTYLIEYWFLLLKDRMRITGIHPQHSLIKSIDVFPITRISKFQTLYRQHRFMSISIHIYWLPFKFMDSDIIYRYLYIPIKLIEMWRDWFWV